MLPQTGKDVVVDRQITIANAELDKPETGFRFSLLDQSIPALLVHTRNNDDTIGSVVVIDTKDKNAPTCEVWTRSDNAVGCFLVFVLPDQTCFLSGTPLVQYCRERQSNSPGIVVPNSQTGANARARSNKEAIEQTSSLEERGSNRPRKNARLAGPVKDPERLSLDSALHETIPPAQDSKSQTISPRTGDKKRRRNAKSESDTDMHSEGLPTNAMVRTPSQSQEGQLLNSALNGGSTPAQDPQGRTNSPRMSDRKRRRSAKALYDIDLDHEYSTLDSTGSPSQLQSSTTIGPHRGPTIREKNSAKDKGGDLSKPTPEDINGFK